MGHKCGGEAFAGWHAVGLPRAGCASGRYRHKKGGIQMARAWISGGRTLWMRKEGTWLEVLITR